MLASGKKALVRLALHMCDNARFPPQAHESLSIAFEMGQGALCFPFWWFKHHLGQIVRFLLVVLL